MDPHRQHRPTSHRGHLAEASPVADGEPRAAPWPAPLRPSATARPASFAVALASGLAVAVLGRFLEEPAAAAESVYLGTLAALLLTAVAALGRRAADRVLPWAAVATVLAAWVLHAGPGRGATVLALLVATVAWGGWRALGGRPGRDVVAAGEPASATTAGGARPPASAGESAARPPARAALRLAALLLPLAVAVQVVFRGAALLDPRPDLHTLVVFLALPVAAAGAVALLAIRHGRAAALLAGAAAVLVGDGLDAAATLALVALAAGELLRDPRLAPPAGREEDAPDTPRAAGPLLVRLAAVAALAAAFAWQPHTAALAAGAALLVGGHPVAVAAVALAAGAAALLAPLQGWGATADVLGLGLLLLPVLPWRLLHLAGHGPRGGVSDRLAVAAPLASSLVLAVATARCAPPRLGPGSVAGAPLDLPALAVPVALLALLAFSTKLRREADDDAPARAVAHPASSLQGAWSGLLLVAAGLAAAYPWLRPEPVGTVLAAGGLRATGWAPLWAAALAAATAYAFGGGPVLRRGSGVHPRPHLALRAVPAVVVLALFPTLTDAPLMLGRTLVGNPGVVLTAERPELTVDLGAETAADGSAAPGSPPAEIDLHQLLVFGSLVRAEGVADETVVMTLVFEGERSRHFWPLRAGAELAEWAARRPEVAAALAHPAPPPWVSWVAPGGDHLGQTYRVAVPPASPIRLQRLGLGIGPAHSLVLRRNPALPREVAIHVERLEVWP